MPETKPEVKILFYRDGRRVPAWEFIEEQPKTARAHFQAAVEQLEEHGYRLERPHAAPLRDGIHEIRFREGQRQLRVLYFFWGNGVVLLTHGLQKEAEVPQEEIERARRMKAAFEADPGNHAAEVE
jgi:phage-related protein